MVVMLTYCLPSYEHGKAAGDIHFDCGAVSIMLEFNLSYANHLARESQWLSCFSITV